MMTPLRPSFTLRFLLALCWSLVSCNLQHDPGRFLDAGLHDTKAVIGKYFNYSIPEPTVKLAEHKFHYEVSEVGTSSIPMWLVFNHTSHTFHGVPLITDKGFYLIKVSLISTTYNASSVQAKDVFAIDVDFGASQDLTKKDILGSVGTRPHQMLYKVEQLSEHIACRRNEIKTLMSVVFDADTNHLNGSSRMSLITRLAPFLNQPLEEFSMSSKHSSVIDKLQKNIVVAAGPGNIQSAGSNEGVVVSWPLPCATQSLINRFPKVMARNIASGHFRDTTGYDVISWYISKARDSSVKARGRSKREAGMTVAPTPKPSQTASVITATSLLSISSTAHSMQTMLTSSVVSTLLFSPSSSDQRMSVFSSSMSGFVLSTLDFSSMQISMYSPSESLHSLTSIGTESIQPSLSQSPFMTSLSTSFLSPTTALFSSSMQISLLSPTSQQRQTLYTSYQTPMSSTVESSKSTIGFVSSSLLMSSNVISPSTSAFPSFQSTNALVSSPSLFQSTKIMSTSLLVTESLSMSSDESVQVSSTSITSVMLYSQSTASMMLATSSEIDISSVFSSSFLSTLLSSDPETTVILQTSSDFRSRSLLPSTEFPRMSSPILSSTLVGTSEFESRSSFRYTTTEISTPPQTPPTSSGSTLPPMQSSFSSQMLTTSLLSSEINPSSTGSVQTSSGLTSTSYVETNSGGSITPILSTETLLFSQIQSSFFSTMSITTPYQTEVTSRLVTTTLSSSEILLTQDVSTASTVFPTSHSPSEIQSSEIVQSMTPTATMSPSITMSSNFSASPGTSSTTSSTSTVISVSDTSYQLVPSTLEMTPSTSGMISSSIVVPETTSVLSMIEVSTLSSTEDITVSSNLLSDNLSSTGIFIDGTSLSEFLSSTMSPEISMPPSLSSEIPYVTQSFLQTTGLSVSTSFSFPSTTLLVSMSEMISQIQSSYISSGIGATSATGTGMIMIPTTFLQTPSISTVSAVTTLVSGVSTSVGTPILSESSLMSLRSSSASEFPVLSTSMAPSLSSTTFVSPSAPSVSLAPSEQTMTISQDSTVFSEASQISTSEISSASDFPILSLTPSLSSSSLASFLTPSVSFTGVSLSKQSMTASQKTLTFSTSLFSTLYNSSAAGPSVYSTFGTATFSSVSFGSSTASVVSSVSDSLAPSELTTSASQVTTSLGLESDYSSTTLFFSESRSETPTSSFFGTSASQQLTSSSSAIIGSSFLQSNMLSSTVVQPSVSSSFMSTSFIISQSMQYSSTTQTVYFLTSSATPDLPSSFSDSRTTSVPSLMTSSVPVTEMLVSTLSPQLSTSSEVMSTSVPSRFFSSTQEIVMSSSPTQTVYSLTSSATPDLPSSFSDSRTPSVPSIMTSSVPVTESLVSTLSPQLSTSSEVMSTSVPSRFFSSTQEIVMSSSPSPTSSSSVPSTPGVLPSTTIMLSSSPAFPQTSSTAGQTSVLPSLPTSDVSLPMSTLLVSTSDIQPTPSYSSQVGVVSTPVVTTHPATTTTETTTEPENHAPIIQHPIDEIRVALGDVLQFSIPEDTFRDPEDGLTFDLQLDLLTTDNQPVSLSHWLQLVNNQQTLAGVPLDSNLTIFRNEYLLSATDSEGLVAYDAFVVKVQKRSLEYNHEFVITLENDFQSFVDDSQNIVSLCGDVASFLKDQNSDAFSVASLSEGSVVMTYSNKTIPTKYCDYETIDNLFSRLAYLNGTPTNAFQDALLPNNAITDIERIFLNLCSVTTEPPVANMTESSVTGTNLLLVTVLPASLVSFLLLICFLICCCYKRKRGGEEFLLREEKPIYAKNRKPIYLDGELNDTEPRGASHPVILPIDIDPVKSSRPFKRKPHKSSSELRPPPPQYRLPDYAQVNLGFDDFENNLYEMEPPTYTSQPVLLDAADSKSLDDRPSPLYRLPPPYQSQDRGFFEESDI